MEFRKVLQDLSLDQHIQRVLSLAVLPNPPNFQELVIKLKTLVWHQGVRILEVDLAKTGANSTSKQVESTGKTFQVYQFINY